MPVISAEGAWGMGVAGDVVWAPRPEDAAVQRVKTTVIARKIRPLGCRLPEIGLDCAGFIRSTI